VKLTPLDIKKQKFRPKVRGLDTAEVESFLEMVADEYEAVLNEKNHLADEVTKLKTQLRDYQQVEKTLQETLMNAQETVSQSRENSKREAQIILREAELKSERIVEEAREKLDKMRNELAILKAQKESFAKRLKHLLDSQIELIRVLEMDDIGYTRQPEEQAKPKLPETGERPGHRPGSGQRVKTGENVSS